jgi:hypothetical protein
MEQWLGDQNTHPNLQSLLLRYLQGRGSLTCVECPSALNLPHSFQEFAKSQDVIGWDNFVVGIVSSKLLQIQSLHLTESNLSFRAMRWITGFITQLLQVMHTQWIYRCVLVHDRTTGMLISTHKEDLLKEIEYQLTLGPNTLAEEDRFLLGWNFDDLTTTTGEHQEYWLLAIKAAREASRLGIAAGAAQRCRPDTRQRRA